MTLRESRFQAELIRKLRNLFPGCVILKNDPNYLQGVPDLLVLWRDRWAALECKNNAKAMVRPNQGYYVTLMDAMSFSAFIYPENEEEILHELQHAFRPRRTTRVSKRQQVSLDQLRHRQANGNVP